MIHGPWRDKCRRPPLRTFWKNVVVVVVVCEHVFHGRALDPAKQLNLLQLEIKRLNCSPTAPNNTMPDRGLESSTGPTWVQAPFGKLRSMEARSLLPRDEALGACAGVADSWDLGFSLPPSVAGSTFAGSPSHRS
jgi:hypothetical protein